MAKKTISIPASELNMFSKHGVKTIKAGSLKIELRPVKKLCPSCNEPWDGLECNECSFDAYCYDPYWD